MDVSVDSSVIRDTLPFTRPLPIKSYLPLDRDFVTRSPVSCQFLLSDLISYCFMDIANELLTTNH
ncbi:MAG TPA: hypothetical protein V6D25_28355 [Leptolyngbyaceae cyanobacterium]